MIVWIPKKKTYDFMVQICAYETQFEKSGFLTISILNTKDKYI